MEQQKEKLLSGNCQNQTLRVVDGHGGDPLNIYPPFLDITELVLNWFLLAISSCIVNAKKKYLQISRKFYLFTNLMIFRLILDEEKRS